MRWVALATSVWLAACGGGTDDGGTAPGATTTIATESDTQTGGPAVGTTAAPEPGPARERAQAVTAPRPAAPPGRAYGPFPFVNYESPHVHPLEQTPDGRLLLAVNTAEGSLMVFDPSPSAPALRTTIKVGTDPVTVRARSNAEAWVLNRVSGTASIVDLQRSEVAATVDLCHEPGDVVFAGAPQKAVISCTRPNRLLVLDAATRALVRSVTVVGEGPRALARSAEGTKVYAAIFESGTPTTVLAGDTNEVRIHNAAQDPAGPWGGVSPVPNAGASYQPPLNPANPPPPPVSTIVQKAGDGYFTGSASCTRAVFGAPTRGAASYQCWSEDPQTGARTPCAAEGGTCLFNGRRRVVFGDGANVSTGAWRDDAGGDWTALVTGSHAALTNRVPGWDLPDRDVAILDVASGRVEYQTRLMNANMAISVHPTSGRVYVVGTDATNQQRFEPVLQGRFLRVQLGSFAAGEAPSLVDLNPHLRYDRPSVPPADRARSIGDPRAIAWTADGTRAYVAGLGSNNVVTIDAAGRRLAVRDVGEGPTGLVLDEARGRLYVLNRFGASISVLGLADLSPLATQAYFDPTPAVIRAGRPFLYDTRLSSGTGHLSCASCHIDGRSDRLAWDLGNPAGAMEQRNGFVFHPMKGPMKTQTLQNIIGSPSLHHRGDRADLLAFADAFQTLLGRDQPLDDTSMRHFEAYTATIAFPPNPHRTLANGDSSAVAVPGPAGSVEAYVDGRVGRRTFLDNGCVNCHVGSLGRSDVRGGNVLHLSQPAAPESLQGFYERMGLYWKSVDGSTAGTGTRTNGAHDSTLENEGSLAFTQAMRAYFLSFEGPRDELANDRSANAHAGVGLQGSLSIGALPPLDIARPVVDPGSACAREGERCAFDGLREVLYGAGSSWRSAVFDGGADCRAAVFGQAADGVVRSCRVLGGTLRRCAGEGQVCAAAGTSDVLYGAVSAAGRAGFTKGVVQADVSCDNRSFPDPLVGTPKACYVRPAEVVVDPGTACANDGGRCSFDGTREVIYGASGAGWRSGVFSGGVDCRGGSFGQAADGIVRSCRVVGAPLRRCADEKTVCVADGINDVLYGAVTPGGAGFVKQLVRNSVRCDNDSFGDPTPGMAKACWVRPADEATRVAFMRSVVDSGKLGWIYTMTRQGTSRSGYYVGSGLFQTDRAAETTSLAGLYAAVVDGWRVSLQMVPRGSEYRLAVDANLDGRLDGDERARGADPRGPAAGAWRLCAAERGTCTVDGPRAVRFGVPGAYAYGVLRGPVACTVATFGDPIYMTEKTCEVAQ